jgi:ankyrin repeat protein
MNAEVIKDFVIAGHFDMDRVKAMLAENPGLLNAAHPWSDTDTETALQAAGHVGNRPIAEFLLAHGAPLEIGVAAMLGLKDKVAEFLAADPSLANHRPVHGITMMFHAALSGDTELAEMLAKHGCHGDYNHALHAAVSKGHREMTEWLLANGVSDVNTLNFQQQTSLKQAVERGYIEIAGLLQAHGAVE